MPSTDVMQDFRVDKNALRDGIAIEKGVILSQDFLSDNFDLIKKYCNYFLLYPDLFLDITKSKSCPINLYFYQRILLRAMMRYRFVFGTFTRATSKSFLAILSQILACIFLPRSKRFVVSQYKKASLDITRQKLDEIWTWYPLLKTEVRESKMSTDYIELEFKNGSIFQILTLSASSRGQRATGGIMEEAALIDGDLLSEVIIPMMNIPRPLSRGGVNPEEPHAQQIYITSAGSKTTFAYERLIELLINECINPEDVFVCGAGYDLPCHYGLFDKKTIQDQRNSNTFSQEGFARESLSIWTGANNESWFNQNKLLHARSLLKAERKAGYTVTEQYYYVLSCDVARYGGNDTSIMIIKVYPHSSSWIKKVVYTENITKESFPQQAIRIKQLAKAFQPKEIVIDGNGIGGGLIDEMVLPGYDSKGQYYPPIYVKNDPENYPYPKENKDQALIYNIKANAQINNDVYSNLYIQINSGNVKLLANERIVREKLMATKKGQKMNYYQREKFLLPYIMTSRLIDEINNLKLKPTGSTSTLAVEQITKRINKDRVSALGYGLYRIKDAEDKAQHKKSRVSGINSMTFFSSSKDKKVNN